MTTIDRERIEEDLMKKDPTGVSILLSKERTLLAKERNAVGLSQLALGIAAFGLVMIRFFVDAEYEWFIAIGIGFVMVSIWLFYHAYKDYMHFRKQLSKLHEKRGHLDIVYIRELE